MTIPEDSMGPATVPEHMRGQDNATTVRAMMLRLQTMDAPAITAPKVIKNLQSAAWLEGMNHTLTWLGLRQYAEVMAKDNPHE